MNKPKKSVKAMLFLFITFLATFAAGILYQQMILSPICSRYAQAAGGEKAIFYPRTGGVISISKQFRKAPLKSAYCSYSVYDPAAKAYIEKEMPVSRTPFSAEEQFLFALDQYLTLILWVIGAILFFWALTSTKKRIRGAKQPIAVSRDID